MSRPKRTTEQEWFDLFADWDVKDQAIALRMLQEQHRQSQRQASRKPKTDANGAAEAAEGATDAV